jgi:hypothetical protein
VCVAAVRNKLRGFNYQTAKAVIASERVGAKRRPMTGSAKQSIVRQSKCGLLRRFAALAMTSEYVSAISPQVSREFCQPLAALSKQRAQGMPGARRTRSLVCEE